MALKDSDAIHLPAFGRISHVSAGHHFVQPLHKKIKSPQILNRSFLALIITIFLFSDFSLSKSFANLKTKAADKFLEEFHM